MREFDLEFEEQVLAASLADTDYLRSAARLLDEHHFGTEYHGWIWRQTRELWTKYAERATPKIISARAKRDFPDADKRRPYLDLAVKLFKLKAESPRGALEELEEFVRFVTMESALEQAATHLEKGDVEKAYEVSRAVTLRDLRPKSYTEIRWIEDFEDRQLARKHRREHPEEYGTITTGIPRLDKIMGGGAQRSELGLVLGTTGRGKSIFLMHLGFSAMCADNGVVYFSLEMPAEQIAARFDARWARILHAKFKAYDFTRKELKLLKEKHARDFKRFKDKLRIISMPLRSANIASLRNAYEEVKSTMKVDEVLVDSGDHMNSMRKHESKRLEQAEVYWDLADWAGEENIVLWSSTHAGKEWADKLIQAEATSESYDKARIADSVLSLSAPKRRSRAAPDVSKIERKRPTRAPDEDKVKVARRPIELFLAKYRDGESKLRIPLETDFARMMISEGEALDRELGEVES
jgi:replicative DNA helicase